MGEFTDGTTAHNIPRHRRAGREPSPVRANRRESEGLVQGTDLEGWVGRACSEEGRERLGL